MRLFIAINFDEKTKDKIAEYQQQLANHVTCRLTKREHIHLTLVFLGEVNEEKAKIIKAILGEIDIPEITLTINRLGCFKRRQGDIWWLGFKQNNPLIDYQRKLTHRLLDAGFTLESRTYQPHVTIARKATRNKDFSPDEISDISFTYKTKSVALMHSAHVNGRLTYTNLFETIVKSERI